MADDKTGAPGGLLAHRLDHLFRTVHPKDRGPYTGAEVAEAINKAAGENMISATYVWQLRTGRRDNPTKKHLSALAASLPDCDPLLTTQTGSICAGDWRVRRRPPR